MIIGLNGFKGSGKNTAGDYLTEFHYYKQASFTAMLKLIVGKLFGDESEKWDRWKNDDDVKITLSRTYSGDGFVDAKEYIAVLTARQFLQRYGTEAHREVFGSDFWVQQLFAQLDREAGFGGTGWGNVVFTDARFDNELQAIRAVGGINIRILRGDMESADGHASEAPPNMSLIDMTIDNNGTYEELYDQLNEVVLALV